MIDINSHALCAHNFAKPEGPVGRQLADIMYECNLPMILKSAQTLDLGDNARLLEIGYGGAQHVTQLMQRYNGLNYTGVEHAHTMHTLAQHLPLAQSPNRRFIKVASNSY